VCDPDLKASRLWGRLHKITRIPHYGWRGLGILSDRNTIHKL
jgi:hypothetical protein